MKSKKRGSRLETDYFRRFSPPAGPMPETLKQPQQLKVVDSKTVYAIYDDAERQDRK